jgi:cytoskeletal protein CcmA (bactofilin family)
VPVVAQSLRALSVLGALALVAGSARADTVSWTGAVSSDWHEPGNWSTGLVPDVASDVFVQAGTPVCVLDGADAAVLSLSVFAGARFECLASLTAGANVVVEGELHVAGTCAAAAAINFGLAAGLSFDGGVLRANDAAFFSAAPILGDGVLELVPTPANAALVSGLGSRPTPPIVATGPGTVELSWVDVSGDVMLTDCNLLWGNTVTQPIVSGDLVLTGGLLVGDLNGTNGGLGVARVRGDVVLSGTGSFTGTVAMAVHGDWTSDDAFAFATSDSLAFDSGTSHVVTLGASATVLPGIGVAAGDVVDLPDGSFTCGGLSVEGVVAPFVGDLVVASLSVDTAGVFETSGALTVASAVTVEGRLAVGGDLVVPALTVAGTGELELGASALQANDLRFDGALAFAPGARIELVPTPSNASVLSGVGVAATSVPPVGATGPGAVVVRGVGVVGDLVLANCQLDWDTSGGIAAAVAGDLELSGGALGGDSNGTSSGKGFLAVAGDVRLVGCSATAASSYVELDGDWSSDDAFVPQGSDELRFAGNLLQTVVLGPSVTSWPSLHVAAGSALLLPPGPLSLSGLVVDGTLAPVAADLVCAALTVGVGGTVDVDGSITAGAFLVAGLVTCTGDLVTPELFDLDTTGTLGLDDGVLRARNATFDGTLLPGWTGSIEIVPANNVVSNLKASSGPVSVPRVTATGPGALALQWVDIQGDLVLDGIQLSWATSAAVSQSVGGDLLMTGGSLAGETGSFSGDSFLTVRGDVVLSGVAATAASAFVNVEGDWTSDDVFVPTASDRFRFRGGTTHVMTIGPNSTALPSIVVDAGDTLVLADRDYTGGSLDVAGVLAPLTGDLTWSRVTVAAGGTMSVAGDVVSTSSVTVAGHLALTGDLVATTFVGIEPTGELLLGTGDLRANDVTVNGNLGANWTGAIELLPKPTNTARLRSTTAARTVPSVRATGPGTVQIEWLDVAGDVELVNCQLDWSPSASVTQSIAGDLTLTGGALGGDPDGSANGESVLVVAGDVVLAGSAAAGGATFLDLAGDWTSDSAYVASVGRVRFLGPSPQVATTGPAADFAALSTLPASAVTFTGDLSVVGAASFAGDVVVAGGVRTGGDLDVAASGTFEQTLPAELRVGGDLDVAGTWDALGALVFDGSGARTASFAAAPTFAGLRLAKTAGSVHFTAPALHVAGDLELDGGNLVVGAGMLVDVDGDLVAEIGGLSFEPAADLWVRGDLASQPSFAWGDFVPIRCDGDWTSGPEFAASSGTVVLAGDARLATTSVGGLTTFNALVLRDGTRSVDGVLSVAAQSVVVEPGAALRIDSGAILEWRCPVLDVGGEVAVDAGGVLGLDATSALTVAPSGRLALIGTAASNAGLVGTGVGGAAVAVLGELAARHATVFGLGAAGLVVDATATLAPAPDDLRAVTFVAGSAQPGGVLLALDRAQATDVVGLVFEDPFGLGAANVRTAGPGALSMVGATGAFAGAAYEDDPLGLVAWNAADATSVASFAAVAGPRRVELAFELASVGLALGFELEVGPGPAGPFVPLAGFPPLSARVFTFSHVGVAADVPLVYRLTQERLDGGIDVLVTAQATPWNDELPASVLTVGPLGDHATIAAALAALPSGRAVVLVAAGTYPAFTVAGPLPGGLVVRADGSGPVAIDTSVLPVVVRDVAAGQWLWLEGLALGALGVDAAGLVVHDCAGVVVLDELVVHAGPSTNAVELDAATNVALQDLELTGALALGNGSSADAMRVDVDALGLDGASTLRSLDVAPASVAIETGSLWQDLGGASARLAAPSSVPLAQAFDAELDGAAGAVWVLQGSLSGLARFDVPLVGFELAVLLDPTVLVPAGLGVLDGNGEALVELVLPGASFVLGYPIVLQGLVVDVALQRSTATNAVLVLGTP